MQSRDYFVHIDRKEVFLGQDGTSQPTGRVTSEWPPFGSFGDAKNRRENALKDQNVIAASIVTDDFRVE